MPVRAEQLLQRQHQTEGETGEHVHGEGAPVLGNHRPWFTILRRSQAPGTAPMATSRASGTEPATLTPLFISASGAVTAGRSDRQRAETRCHCRGLCRRGQSERCARTARTDDGPGLTHRAPGRQSAGAISATPATSSSARHLPSGQPSLEQLPSDVQCRHIEPALCLDELPPRGHFVAHQTVKMRSASRASSPDALHHPRAGIHRFPITAWASSSRPLKRWMVKLAFSPKPFRFSRSDSL